MNVILPVHLNTNPHHVRPSILVVCRNFLVDVWGFIAEMCTRVSTGILTGIQAIFSALSYVWAAMKACLSALGAFLASCTECWVASPMTYNGFVFVICSLFADIAACSVEFSNECLALILSSLGQVCLAFATRATILEERKLRDEILTNQKNNSLITLQILQLKEEQQGQNFRQEASRLTARIQTQFTAWKTETNYADRQLRQSNLTSIMQEANTLVEQYLNISL